ncbi:DoxX family protein [Ochrovirga pacifica]|uniref:DoxX family protein n=1 Tax=Ochrovirga pacifica TaxID=1042376 RepID=UPI0002557767|nr:DoxX family protein [Ochrovirga pacifica]
MKKILLSNKSWGIHFPILLLRVTFGAAMLFGHGLGKWKTLVAGGEIKFMNFLGIGTTASLALAVFAEVICAALLVLGLLTRMALIPLITTMAVALFMIHPNDAFATQEKSLLYLVAYVVLFIYGAGKYSVDGLLKK